MKYQEWKHILQKGIDGELTEDEHNTIAKQHSDWNCCAVGAKIMCDMKVDNLLTANDAMSTQGNLISEDVWQLGNFDFPASVCNRNYRKALKILETIYAMDNIYTSDEERDLFIEEELKYNH